MTDIEPLRRRGGTDEAVPERVTPAAGQRSSDIAGSRAADPGSRASGLTEVLDALRWRWPLALLVAAAITAGATVYVESLPSKYDAHALVAFSPRPDVSGASSDTVRVLVPKYPSYVVAPATIQRVAAELGYSRSEVSSAVDANVKTDTGTLTITARTEDPTRSAVIANTFAQRVLAFAENDRLLEGQLLAPALPPTSPSAPHRRLLEAAALIVGLLGGIGISLLVERGRPRLRSWREMASMTGYPVIGRIPPSRIVRRRPTEAFSEPVLGSSVRTLRANLEPQLRAGGVETIVITSPTKADGKTVVSTLLAEALARRGLRVVLIDADLRRTRLSRVLGSDSAGLSGVMRGKARLQDVATPGWARGLWVIPTAADDESGDLLATKFADVLSEVRERFDIVLVDSPPLLGTDDARTLARAADGVLLVVGAGSEAGPVNEAILALESLEAPLIGIVGNRIKESKSLYYY